MVIEKEKEKYWKSFAHNWKSMKMCYKRKINEKKLCQNKRITKSKEWGKWKRMNNLCNEDTQSLCSLILKALWIQRKTMISCSLAPLQA